MNVRWAVNAASALLAVAGGIWYQLQPTPLTHGDRLVCNLLVASWKPLWLLLPLAVLVALGVGWLGHGRRLPHIAWSLGLGALVPVVAGLVFQGHTRSQLLCRVQERALAQVMAPPPNATLAEKEKAKNRAELIQQAAASLAHPEKASLPPAAAAAVLEKAHAQYAQALGATGAQMVEAVRKDKDPLADAPAAPGEPPPEFPQQVADALAEGTPPTLPQPPASDPSGDGLPPEVMAALFAGCLAAGVSAPICTFGAAVLGDLLKSRGKDLKSGDVVRLAEAVAMVLGAMPGSGEESPPTDLPEEAEQVLGEVLADPRLKPHVPGRALPRPSSPSPVAALPAELAALLTDARILALYAQVHDPLDIRAGQDPRDIIHRLCQRALGPSAQVIGICDCIWAARAPNDALACRGPR